jgi:putative copper export protein
VRIIGLRGGAFRAEDTDCAACRFTAARVDRAADPVDHILEAVLVVGYAWLLLETHAVASTTNLAQTVTAVPTVLFDTQFDQVLALQAIAIACAIVAVWRVRSSLAASLAGAAVMLEAGHSHAFAMAHIPLLLPQMLHLTAAGAGLGGLLPLLIVVREAPLETAQYAPGASLPSVRSRSACLPSPRSFRGRCFRADLRDSPELLTARSCY